VVNATHLDAPQGALQLTALGDVLLGAPEQAYADLWDQKGGHGNIIKKTKWHHSGHDETVWALASHLSGAHVTLKAGEDLSTYASKINAQDDLAIQAGGEIRYYAVLGQHERQEKRESSHSSLKVIRLSHSNTEALERSETPLVTELQADQSVFSASGGNTLLDGTRMTSAKPAQIKVGLGEKARRDARLELRSVRERITQQVKTDQDWVLWQKHRDQGRADEHLYPPEIHPDPEFQAAAFTVDWPDPQGMDPKAEITRLAQQPGFGYLKALLKNPQINWQQVKTFHRSWDYRQEGLTPAGAVLLAVLTSCASGGLGAELLGLTAGGTQAIAANAAVQSFNTQAALHLANNQGNLGKTLRQLGRSDTVKAILTSTISAGIADHLAGIAGLKTVDPKTLELSQRLTRQFLKATTDALTYAIVDATVRGADLVTYLQDHLKTMLLASLVDTAHAEATQQIKRALLSSPALKNLAQTLAGCAAGAARGGSCASGALGSATAELIGILKPPEDPIQGYSEKEKPI
jgi:filamentous hemagglutinin